MSKGNEKTVLIVEKQPNYTQVLVKQIIVAGLKPVIAVTGEGGLRKVEECRPDLILVEAELSDMDGLSFVSEVRQNPAADRIPIVAMSVFPQLKDSYLEVGCNDFLQKPIRMIELMARLKRFIHSDPNRDATKNLQQDSQHGAGLPRRKLPDLSGEEMPSPKENKKEPETIDELLVLNLASVEALAKLLSEKQVITEKEYREKISQEQDNCRRIIQKIGEGRIKTS